MARIVFVLLSFVVVLSTAEQISFNSCFYPDGGEGPKSANLIKKDNGFELQVTFWAKEINQNSPLKVKLHGSDFNSVTKLVSVLYPIQTSITDNKYMEHKITLPIPKMEITSDKLQLSLYNVSNDGNETAVWCMRTSVKVLNGLKDEEENTSQPRIAICGTGPLPMDTKTAVP